MSQAEHKTLAALIIALPLNSYFAWRVVTGWQAGAFEGDSGIAHWAQLVVWVIPISLGLNIAASILIDTIGSRDPGAKIVDERDRQIGRHGMIVGMVVTYTAVIAMIAGLALNMAVLAALNIVLAGCTIADIGGNATRLFLYRRGY